LKSSNRKSHQPITKEIDLNDEDVPSYENMPFASAPSLNMLKESRRTGKAAVMTNQKYLPIQGFREHCSNISEEAPICYTDLVHMENARKGSPQAQFDQLPPVSKTAMSKHQRNLTSYEMGAYRPLATETLLPVDEVGLEFTSKRNK
jgi:hypothetical protein